VHNPLEHMRSPGVFRCEMRGRRHSGRLGTDGRPAAHESDLMEESICSEAGEDHADGSPGPQCERGEIHHRRRGGRCTWSESVTLEAGRNRPYSDLPGRTHAMYDIYVRLPTRLRAAMWRRCDRKGRIVLRDRKLSTVNEGAMARDASTKVHRRVAGDEK